MNKDSCALQMLIFRAVGLQNPTEQDLEGKLSVRSNMSTTGISC